jgi:hypothetical protein
VFPPSVLRHFTKFAPLTPSQNLAELILEKRGITPDQIDQVIFRYVLQNTPVWTELFASSYEVKGKDIERKGRRGMKRRSTRIESERNSDGEDIEGP